MTFTRLEQYLVLFFSVKLEDFRDSDSHKQKMTWRKSLLILSLKQTGGKDSNENLM